MEPGLLQRITTEYSAAEDRIRISGETQEGALTVLWLTQRLVARLLPPLLEWLGQQYGDPRFAEIRQSFDQQAAVGALVPQAPVVATESAQEWLVMAVDITRTQESLALTFRSAQDHRVAVHMASVPMRQWLEILHTGCQKGGWPMEVWPDWIREASPGTTPPRSQALLH